MVVHFIKRNEWFLEAALALLGPSINGDEGRIDRGEGNADPTDEPTSTIIAKTQSFRRDLEDQDADESEAESLADGDVESLPQSPIVQEDDSISPPADAEP